MPAADKYEPHPLILTRRAARKKTLNILNTVCKIKIIHIKALHDAGFLFL